MTRLLVQEVPNRTQRVTGTDGSHGLPGSRGALAERAASGRVSGEAVCQTEDRSHKPRDARRALHVSSFSILF